MDSSKLKQISECFIKPKYEVEESKKPYYLSPWDLHFLGVNYAEHGLLFKKPQTNYPTQKLLQSLKDSLALTLVHFYPLAGQLVTEVDNQRNRCLIYVDCKKGPGAKFIHTTLDLTVFDLLSSTYVPPIVKHFFDHDNGQINYDGHTKPLLSVKVIELIDGLFLGISFNHMMADGIGYWHFLKCWSEIYNHNNEESYCINQPPILNRWLPQGYGSEDLYFPYTHAHEFISSYEPPPLRERFFYISSTNVRNLKVKVNKENKNGSKISSLQAVLALVWRSIIRTRGLPTNQITNCLIVANERTKLNPHLPPEYFGNALSRITASTTVGKLMENGLEWTAQLLHKAVEAHYKKDVSEFFNAWFKSPFVSKRPASLDGGTNSTIQVGGSPRSNLYDNKFGVLGKPIAIRSGNANKFDGKVYANPGIEGDDSMELDICLSSHAMAALESDEEFMPLVSCSPSTKVVCRL